MNLTADRASNHRRTKVVGGDSPVDVAVPFWITACVRLQPPRRRNGGVIESAADKVLTAVQVLLADRIEARSAVAVVLDRTKIARWCGYDSSKKASWLFDYLVSIGFMTIEQQYVQGRRGRAADTFTVFTQPPGNYAGPLTYAALDQALSDPASAQPLFVNVPKTHRSRSRYPDGQQDQALGSHLGTKTDEPAGQGLGTQMGTKTNALGSHLGTKTDEPAGQGLGTQMGTFLQIDQRSSISEREIEDRSIEPVPGGTAKPPATGLERAAAVRELVRRLPWAEWAKRRGGQRFRLTSADADAVQEAIYEAITRFEITLEQAALIGQAALGEAKKTPVAYVAGAFQSPKLERRLRALGVEPLSDDPLPLPGEPNEEQANVTKPTRQAGAAALDLEAGESAGPVLRACETCGAREGEGPTYRRVTGEDGRQHPCPDCQAAAAA